MSPRRPTDQLSLQEPPPLLRRQFLQLLFGHHWLGVLDSRRWFLGGFLPALGLARGTILASVLQELLDLLSALMKVFPDFRCIQLDLHGLEPTEIPADADDRQGN